MTSKTAIKKLANRIFDDGEIEGGDGCFLPSWYAPDDQQGSEFVLISDSLYEKYKATHFSRVWQVKGRLVRIQLFAGDGFGACLDIGDPVHSEVVELTKKEKKNEKN